MEILTYTRRLPMFLLPIALSIPLVHGQSRSITLEPNTFLNLDGGVVSNTGGDIFWDGGSLLPQSRAGLFNLGKYGRRAYEFINVRQASEAPYKPNPIQRGALVTGDVFGVHTNSGSYSKVLVTGNENGSLSLQFTTFPTAQSAAAPAASSAPAVAKVQNNYSYILPGLPNYGIAPGSLFVIFGSGLSSSTQAVLQSSAAPGLPTTLNTTSIAVTVNGVKTTPAIYYSIGSAVAAVLPSNTPVGTGTITVTANGVAGAPALIQVVAHAPGLDTLYGTGNGLGVFTDNTTGKVITPANPATPGEVIVLWGSGLGADMNNDDRTYPQNQNNLTSFPTQVFIGGVSATVLYQGRSQFPGLDQYDVTVPNNVTPGCFVGVTVVAGSLVSNTVTLPVSPGGGSCSDPASGLNGTMLQTLANKPGGSVNSMLLTINQQTNARGTQAAAIGIPASLPSAYYGGGYEYASQGSCTIVPPDQGTPAFINTPLNAGAIQVTSPGGQQSVLNGIEVPLSNPAPGTYTFSGAGGSDVGSFKASVNFQGPLTWTNQKSLATVTRSQGATITWTGGFANGDVQVEGETGGQLGTVRFYCHAPSSAGQIVVPPSIMMAVAPGPGDIVVTNTTAPTPITASGLDVGFAVGTAITQLQITFK